MSRSFVIYSKTKRPNIENPENTIDYIEYEYHEIKKSTGDNPEDFEIVEEVEERKTNIDKFINSFKDDVGVENILKRVAATGDLTLLNQREALYMDTTIVPEDPGEAFALSQSVEEKYENIDPKLTEGKSMEEFLSSLSDEDLEKYIQKVMAERKKEKENESSETIK